MGTQGFFLSGFDGDCNGISKGFMDLSTNIFPYADDIVRGSHADDLPIIRDVVESGVDSQPPFSIDGFDIDGDDHIGCIHGSVLQENSMELMFHKYHLTILLCFLNLILILHLLFPESNEEESLLSGFPVASANRFPDRGKL